MAIARVRSSGTRWPRSFRRDAHSCKPLNKILQTRVPTQGLSSALSDLRAQMEALLFLRGFHSDEVVHSTGTQVSKGRQELQCVYVGA